MNEPQLPIWLGFDPIAHQMAETDLGEIGHLIVYGPDPRQAADFLNGAILRLTETCDGRYMLVSSQSIDLQIWRPFTHAVYEEDDDVEMGLEWLANDMGKRLAKVRSSGSSSLSELNMKLPPAYRDHYTILVTSHLGSIVQMRPHLSELLIDLARQGPRAGIHLIISSGPGDVLPDELVAEMPSRVAFAPVDDEGMQRYFASINVPPLANGEVVAAISNGRPKRSVGSDGGVTKHRALKLTEAAISPDHLRAAVARLVGPSATSAQQEDWQARYEGAERELESTKRELRQQTTVASGRRSLAGPAIGFLIGREIGRRD